MKIVEIIHGVLAGLQGNFLGYTTSGIRVALLTSRKAYKAGDIVVIGSGDFRWLKPDAGTSPAKEV